MSQQTVANELTLRAPKETPFFPAAVGLSAVAVSAVAGARARMEIPRLVRRMRREGLTVESAFRAVLEFGQFSVRPLAREISKHPDEAGRLLSGLGRSAADAEPLLLQQLYQDSRYAAAILPDVAGNQPKTCKTLLSYLHEHEPNPSVIECLSHFRDTIEQYAPHLLQHMREEFPSGAIFTHFEDLGEAGVPILAAALKQRNVIPGDAREALEVCTRLGNKAAGAMHEIALIFLQRSSPEERKMAAKFFGELEPAKIAGRSRMQQLRLLEALLHSLRYPDVAQEMGEALRRLGPGVGALSIGLEHDDLTIRRACEGLLHA